MITTVTTNLKITVYLKRLNKGALSRPKKIGVVNVKIANS